jgi:hypothetical protein
MDLRMAGIAEWPSLEPRYRPRPERAFSPAGVRAFRVARSPIGDGQESVGLKDPIVPSINGQSTVPISVDAALTDQRRVGAITVIVHDNRAPVAAVSVVPISVSVRRSASIFGATRAVRVSVETGDHARQMTAALGRGSGGDPREQPAGRRACDRREAADRSHRMRWPRRPLCGGGTVRRQAPHPPADHSGE